MFHVAFDLVASSFGLMIIFFRASSIVSRLTPINFRLIINAVQCLRKREDLIYLDKFPVFLPLVDVVSPIVSPRPFFQPRPFSLLRRAAAVSH